MKYIIGKDRNQIALFCLEERINEDNEIRLIELFVDSLPIADYGFKEEKINPLGVCGLVNLCLISFSSYC